MNQSAHDLLSALCDHFDMELAPDVKFVEFGKGAGDAEQSLKVTVEILPAGAFSDEGECWTLAGDGKKTYCYSLSSCELAIRDWLPSPPMTDDEKDRFGWSKPPIQRR